MNGQKMLNNTDWYKDAVFYELNVRAFCDSDGDGIGDLAGLTTRLDYLKALGVDVIWLLPLTDSPLRDDGYDVRDHFLIYPPYGTMEDFHRLVAEAHALDLKVVVELIPNHTSDEHAWFVASRDPQHPDHQRYRDYYVWSDTNELYQDARIIFVDVEESNWTYDPVRKAYYWHRFFHHQPDLNYDNPAVQRDMLKVIQFWIDQGADGIRVDAPPYLYQREGTNCENLPETHAYFKRLRAFVDAYAPGTVLIAEANQWPEDVREYFGDGDEFQMNFHFPLMPRIFMALAKADRRPIEWVLARTPSLPPSCQWGTFLRNHDELTLEMVTPEDRRFMWDFYAPEPRMPLNMGIRRRLAPLLDNSLPRLQVSHSILLTIIGSPFLYYGDEIGMGDNIYLKDRDGVRTPMQWDGSTNAGFSKADSAILYAPVIDDEIFGYRRVNVELQEADPGSLLNWLRGVLRVRRRHPAFSRGSLTLLDVAPGSVLAYLRQYQGQTLLILNNLSDSMVQVDLEGKVERGKQLANLLNGERETGQTVELEPYGFRWYRVR
ncbi:MAG: maltose alpha-D-glucosyltransferase [Anaerolineales bacterium]|nr:maltose alpha-D-glucosyltransferase [Anaerolineales bacterium]